MGRCFAASHLGLFCLPMSHKKDVKRILVKSFDFHGTCIDRSEHLVDILVGSDVF